MASNEKTRERGGNPFTIVKFGKQVDRQPDCKGTDAKDDTGHKTLAGIAWYATAFWGWKTKEVPTTNRLKETCPSFVMTSARMKVAKVVRSKVIGKLPR